jgi:pimeloyl-ACP methyl ester carboxylesterase
MKTHTLETPEVDLVYDVHGPLPPANGHPPLFMIGAPMDASGFATLASHFTDRTVLTYDPRGLGRSTRKDGRVTHTPVDNAVDVHRIIETLGGPVEMFASSGGAVTALELVAKHPNDVTILVAHEPPIATVLPDAERAHRAFAAVRDAYNANGWGAGMAAFMAMTSWQGEFTDAFLAQAPPDPAMFGMPTGDDGSRADPLLSDRSRFVVEYEPDVAALKAAPTRILIAVGIETGDTFTARTARATAALLGQEAVEFPSHHGGFLGGEHGYAGQPEAFAERLRDVLGMQTATSMAKP